MRSEIYQHQNIQKIPSSYQRQVSKAISSAPTKRPISTQKIRRSIMNTLHENGWSNEIRIAPTISKMDITSMKGDVGLCFQTGNMSRFYADILKLQTLFVEQKIKGSICIVPKQAFAKSFGQNIAYFERIVKELAIFSKTITVPILIYGIEE